MSHTQHLVAVVGTAVCWGVVALTWLVGALYNASRGPRQRGRAPLRPLEIAAVILTGAIFWVIFQGLPQHTWHPLRVSSLWATGIGLVILLVSTAFTLWARPALGTMWSWNPVVKQGHKLRTDGPYAITRHPIYTGILAMLLGSILLAGAGRRLLLLPLAFALFEIKIHEEEQLMQATFPNDYPRYRQRVPQLVPRLRLRTHRVREGS